MLKDRGQLVFFLQKSCSLTLLLTLRVDFLGIRGFRSPSPNNDGPENPQVLYSYILRFPAMTTTINKVPITVVTGKFGSKRVIVGFQSLNDL